MNPGVCCEAPARRGRRERGEAGGGRRVGRDAPAGVAGGPWFGVPALGAGGRGACRGLLVEGVASLLGSPSASYPPSPPPLVAVGKLGFVSVCL